MKVFELQKILDELSDSDDEMEVFVEADHGQNLEHASGAGVEEAYKDGGEWFGAHPDDVAMGEYEGVNLQRIFVIGGQ